MITRPLAAAVMLSLWTAAPPSIAADNPSEWTQPTAPFRIAGDVYDVGTQGLASYLIAHPELADVLTRRGADRFAPSLLQDLVVNARAAFERAHAVAKK